MGTWKVCVDEPFMNCAHIFPTKQKSVKQLIHAFDHALRCGQLSETTRTVKAERGERQSYSEDLY